MNGRSGGQVKAGKQEDNCTAWHGQATRSASSRQPNGPGPAPPIFQRRLVIVNAALFMLTSAWMAGADPAPAKDARMRQPQPWSRRDRLVRAADAAQRATPAEASTAACFLG